MCPLEAKSQLLMAKVAGDAGGEILCSKKGKCLGRCPHPIPSDIHPETWEERSRFLIKPDQDELDAEERTLIGLDPLLV